jgi:hypothetical protein
VVATRSPQRFCPFTLTGDRFELIETFLLLEHIDRLPLNFQLTPFIVVSQVSLLRGAERGWP